jgi:hypothetical protein
LKRTLCSRAGEGATFVRGTVNATILVYSFQCLAPERATHFQELRPAGEQLKSPENGFYSVKLTVPSRQSRKRIEMLFAHLKRILKMGRLRLRGPCGARDEFLLAATARNLRKLAKLVLPIAPQMMSVA